ncbi:MAG: hypothetical protein K2X90_04565 [Candidatus Babeliaceae bacterium]|nr:hypothetical protein [Candidatus Babeliaceae bacterium]
MKIYTVYNLLILMLLTLSCQDNSGTVKTAAEIARALASKPLCVIPFTSQVRPADIFTSRAIVTEQLNHYPNTQIIPDAPDLEDTNGYIGIFDAQAQKIGDYFSNPLLPLRQQALLVALDSIAQKKSNRNKTFGHALLNFSKNVVSNFLYPNRTHFVIDEIRASVPIEKSDLVENDGRTLFGEIPPEVLQALKAIYNISDDLLP